MNLIFQILTLFIISATIVHAVSIEFRNHLKFPIQLFMAQKGAAKQIATIATGKSFTYSVVGDFTGRFTHTNNVKATLFEINVSGSLTSYDINLVNGFNVPMKVQAPDGTKIQALNARAPDAILSPKDDRKLHSTRKNGKFVVIFGN